jgi:hypothetical protein
LSGGTDFYGVIYAPTRNFKRSGGSEYYGMIIANSLDLSGGGGLHFDSTLSNLSGTAPTPRLVN